MKKFVVIVRQIKEMDVEVMAEDEFDADEKAESLDHEGLPWGDVDAEYETDGPFDEDHPMLGR